MAYEYNPYTSENLEIGNAVVDDITAFSGIGTDLPTFPNGKQVIFFSIGLVCVITSLTLMVRSLVDVPSITELAKLAL